MKTKLSDTTLAFVLEYGLFTCRRRQNEELYSVVDRIGFNHCECDDEETALAIVESLNAVGGDL